MAQRCVLRGYMLRLIQSCKVEMGMYVHDLKTKWIAHPFWRSRFVVDRADILERVRNTDGMVMIDTDRGRDVTAKIMRASQRGADGCARAPQGAPGRLDHKPRIPQHWPQLSQRVDGTRVIAPVTFGRADRERALAVAQRSTSAVKALFEGCLQGRAIATPSVLTVVDDIARTLEHNVSAFVSVIRLKAKDDETYMHSVAVCALMICLAREAGLPADTARELGMAGLLHDIGKMSIDDAILKKEGALTAAEQKEIRRHPQLGFELLRDMDDLPAVVRDVCLHHHERLDGSGYPFGLGGQDITRAARIAAVCDVYDAMTSDRPYRAKMTPASVLAQMDEATGEFDSELVFCLMRMIGVMPPGKLVRLRSNRLAVVLPSRFENRCLLARVFYSTIDASLLPYQDVVVHEKNAERAIAAEDPTRWFANDWGAMSARILAGEPAFLSN